MASDDVFHGRILIVDDVESNRYVMGTWLRRAGHTVAEAATGQAALEAVERERFDLVILDVNLPDMTGYDVCEYIKARYTAPSLPVLHVSATAVGPLDRSEGLRRGADGYLIEPVEREELLASVEALLRGFAAQRTALRLTRRLRLLNDATQAINEAVTLEQLIGAIVNQASALFETTALVLGVFNDQGVVAGATPGEGHRIDIVGAGTVEALRRSIGERRTIQAGMLAEITPVAVFDELLVSELGEPGGDRGLLLVEMPEDADAALGDESVVVLKQFARAASTALRNMRSFDIEREIALTLQRNLLPGVGTSFPGFDVAVRYKASAEHAEVGGDFYEIFALDDETLVVAAGDVVGHSLDAATVMAQLRTAIRSYMLEGHDPESTIVRLNQLLLRFHPDVTATVCCAVLNSRTGDGALANAGHPPPLIANTNGATFLPTGGSLLGVEGVTAPAHRFTLLADDVLLLYTDGLIERRGEMIDDGLRRLVEAVAERSGNLELLCDRVLERAGPENPEDDIALVALRRREG